MSEGGGAFEGPAFSGFKPTITICREQPVAARVLLGRWACEAEKSGMKQLFFMGSSENLSLFLPTEGLCQGLVQQQTENTPKN